MYKNFSHILGDLPDCMFWSLLQSADVTDLSLLSRIDMSWDLSSAHMNVAFTEFSYF